MDFIPNIPSRIIPWGRIVGTATLATVGATAGTGITITNIKDDERDLAISKKAIELYKLESAKERVDRKYRKLSVFEGYYNPIKFPSTKQYLNWKKAVIKLCKGKEHILDKDIREFCIEYRRELNYE